MTISLHPTAQVDAGLLCGHNVVVNAHARIGTNCQIGNGVVIHAGTQIGDGVRIDDHAVIGKPPLHPKQSETSREAELAPCFIEDGCVIGTLTVIYRGARLEEGVTVADMVTVREETRIGAHTAVGRGVAVENKVEIGTRCTIEANAYIAALSDIDDDCFISPGVMFTNDRFLGRIHDPIHIRRGVNLMRGARVGANSTILPGITIGEDALVAAGSIVTHDVAARMTVMGVPARELGPVSAEQLLEFQ